MKISENTKSWIIIIILLSILFIGNAISCKPNSKINKCPTWDQKKMPNF